MTMTLTNRFTPERWAELQQSQKRPEAEQAKRIIEGKESATAVRLPVPTYNPLGRNTSSATYRGGCGTCGR